MASGDHTSSSVEVVSNYHIDLWEHGTKLFRLLHWQQAAEIFEFLANDIIGTKERTKCLVNRALIEARLGDYHRAALTIADAAELGADLPITAFIAALINAEIGELPLAEAWFEACLNCLAEPDVDYDDERLKFVLTDAAVKHNLDSTSQARLAGELGFNDAAPDDLLYLPAELLFEAPLRTGSPSPTDDLAALLMSNEVAEAAAPDPDTSAPRQVLSHVPSSAYSVASMSQRSSAPLIQRETCTSPGKTTFDQSLSQSPQLQGSKRRPHKSIIIDPLKALKSPAQPSPPSSAKELRAFERIRRRDAALQTEDMHPARPKAKIPYTWHGHQDVQYEPREPHGVSNRTRHLADFVTDFAPDDSMPVHELARARDRKAAHGDPRGWPEDADDSDDELALRPDVFLRAGSGSKSRADQRPRTATLDTGTQARVPRHATAPHPSSGLFKALRSPQTAHAGHKSSKFRWPFQDDPDEDEPSSEPSASASPTALKPVPLDFIMGPDGKTIVVEKPCKAAPSRAQALQQIQEARRHEGAPLPSSSPVPWSPPPDHSLADQSADLPLLQPTVYEPPTWRKREQLTSPSSGSPSSPFNPISVEAQRPLSPIMDMPRRRPVPQSPGTTSSEPSGLSPSGEGESRYSPSVVSSINMWDYILDKIKPEGGGKSGRR